MRSEQTSRSSPTLGSISCLTDLVAHHQLYQSWLFLVAYHPRFLEGSTFDLQFFHGCFLVGGLHVPVSALAECCFHGYHWYCELYLGPLASKHRWILSHFHQSFSRSGSFDREAFSARKETVESPGPVEQWITWMFTIALSLMQTYFAPEGSQVVPSHIFDLWAVVGVVSFAHIP